MQMKISHLQAMHSLHNSVGHGHCLETEVCPVT